MKTLLMITAIAICIVSSGCSRAPSVSIIGSFFPIWMICIAAGVIAAFVEHAVLARFSLEHRVGPLWLFYPSTVTLCACVLWEVFFR
ncbi:MAG TPA: YtcA family lipoprotein [Bryobacteraceae bacterium]|nr:YtcA family lipoprotein [Bryobacteraceae bacterium]